MHRFLNEAWRGDWLPICPFEKGDQMGWNFGCKEQYSKLFQYQPDNLSLVNSSVSKINPALAGKCIAVAVAVGMAAKSKGVLAS